jgi:hypothetical protein
LITGLCLAGHGCKVANQPVDDAARLAPATTATAAAVLTSAPSTSPLAMPQIPDDPSICADYGGFAFMAQVAVLQDALAKTEDLWRHTGDAGIDETERAALRNIGQPSVRAVTDLTRQCAAFRRHPIRPGEEKIQESFIDDCERLTKALSRLSELIEQSFNLQALHALSEQYLFPGPDGSKFGDMGAKRAKQCRALAPDSGQILTATGSTESARPCSDSTGAVRADELAANCKELNRGSDVLCDKQNPCPVIIERLKRGCGMFVGIGEDDPICTPFAGRPCKNTAGPRRANELVKRCIEVSPATHPPCNVNNACSLIEDEIDRGCGFLQPGDAPAYCRKR